MKSPEILNQLNDLMDKLAVADSTANKAQAAYSDAYDEWKSSHREVIETRTKANITKNNLSDEVKDLIRKAHDAGAGDDIGDVFSYSLEPDPLFDKQILLLHLLAKHPETFLGLVDDKKLDKFLIDNSEKSGDGHKISPLLGSLPVTYGTRPSRITIHWSRLSVTPATDATKEIKDAVDDSVPF